MGTPMEGFFDGTDIMAKAMAPTPAAAQGAPVETSIPSPKPDPVEESAQTERVGEFTSILAEAPTHQKRVTPTDASQTRSASLATPPIICGSDPFATFSQAIKDGSFLVVTPSSIPSSTTRGPNADLSSDEGSEEVFEDSKDDSITKKRVSNFDEDDSGKHETAAMGMCLLPLLDLLFSPSPAPPPFFYFFY